MTLTTAQRFHCICVDITLSKDRCAQTGCLVIPWTKLSRPWASCAQSIRKHVALWTRKCIPYLRFKFTPTSYMMFVNNCNKIIHSKYEVQNYLFLFRTTSLKPRRYTRKPKDDESITLCDSRSRNDAPFTNSCLTQSKYHYHPDGCDRRLSLPRQRACVSSP